MADRQYGIPPGYIESRGRLTPPEPPQHASDPAQSYSARDVSPIRHEEGTSRDGNFGLMAGGFDGAASAGTAAGVSQGSGAQALRDIDNLYNSRMMPPSPAMDGPYAASSMDSFHTTLPAGLRHGLSNSQSSLSPLAGDHALPPSPERATQRGFPGGAAIPTGVGGGAVGSDTLGFGARMPRSSYYEGDGYDYNPANFVDDGDDGLEERPRSQLPPAIAAGAGAGTSAGVLKAFGGGSRDLSGGNYGPVGADPEKSEWLAKQSTGNKKMKWIVGVLVAVLILGGIAGGVAGGLLANKHNGSSGSGSGGGSSGSGSGSGGGSGSHSDGLYDLNSRQVQAVLNNKNLHKVFPAMDYTPNYAQYPQCLSPGGGPIQNNVTIDVAIMSQLTPAIRLYGTDCNQTELVLEAIDRLQMKDTMKVWLGVYLDGNQTTNDRQLAQFWDILDKYDDSYFVGAIIGNEVLYSKYMSSTDLATQLTNVRNNFTSKGINIPVSTADLGDNWDSSLAQSSDIVMSNIHPFFAGVVAEEGAGWAYSFWENKDAPLTTSDTKTNGNVTYPTQIISEIGWPTQGGNDCGDSAANAVHYGCTSDTDGAVASLDNLNTFMNDYICGALNNGTTFFWFEAFDEPWKHQFDTTYDHWEPYWGLFDSNRNLKDGVNIPSCNGKTVNKPY